MAERHRAGGEQPGAGPHGRHHRRAQRLPGNVAGPSHRRRRHARRLPGRLRATTASSSSASTTSPTREPEPLATWINYGQHPECLDSYDLITADYLGPARAHGGPGDRRAARVQPGRRRQRRAARARRQHQPSPRRHRAGPCSHAGSRPGRAGRPPLADAIVEAWNAIGAGGGQVPYTTDVPVDMVSLLGPRPVSHPYPERVELPHRADGRGQPRRADARPARLRARRATPTPRQLECGRTSRRHGLARARALRRSRRSGRRGEPAPPAPSGAPRRGPARLVRCEAAGRPDPQPRVPRRRRDPADIYDGFDWSVAAATRQPDGSGRAPTLASGDDNDRSLAVSDDALPAHARPRSTTTPRAGTTPPTRVAANAEPADPAAI